MLATSRPALDWFDRRIADEDPELSAAADEVDVSLLRWSMSLSPIERLRVCTQNTRTLDKLRDAARGG